MVCEQQETRKGTTVPQRENIGVGRSVPEKWALTAALALGLAAIFFLPYHVPMQPTLSGAYMIGYNSRVGLLLVLSVTVGFAAWTHGHDFHFADTVGSKVSKTVFWTTVLITLSVALGEWWASRYVGPANEALYFADRYASYEMGFRPYWDFEFPYGPILFYLPIAVRSVTHLSLISSYYLALLFQWLVGIWILKKIVELVAATPKEARAVYLILWATFAVSITDNGPNYTPIRFCATLLGALLVHRAWRTRDSMIPASLLATGVFLFALFYSPEQAITFFAATIFFLLLNYQPQRHGYFSGLVLLLSVAGIGLFAADHIGVLQTFKDFGGGNLNLPIVFSFVNVTELLLLVVAACGCASAIASGRRDHPLVYLCLIAGANSPAAFGRADPGHIFVNTLGAMLSGLLLLYPHPRRWTLARWSVVSFLVVYNGAIHVYNSRGPVMTALRRASVCDTVSGQTLRAFYHLAKRHDSAEESTKKAEEERKAWTAEMYAQRAATAGEVQPFLAPFGIHRRTFEENGGPTVITGRFNALLPLVSRAQVTIKIRELQARPNSSLLLPEGKALQCDDETDKRLLMQEVLTPLYLPPDLHTQIAAQPLCNYIDAHYTRTTDNAGFVGMNVWNSK